MYKLIFSNSALKKFKKLEKNLQKRIITSLERIRVRPETYVTKLIGDPAYKLRVGAYRIILEIDKNHLFILVINLGHRKNIYTIKGKFY